MAKKPIQKRPPAKKRPAHKKKQLTPVQRTTTRMREYLRRRPHRSFRLTRRRDYVRPLALPGYWRLIIQTFQTVWKYKNQFMLLGLIYIVLSAALVGLASQETINQLRTTLSENFSAEMFGTTLASVGQTAMLTLNLLGGGGSGTFTEAQQVYAALIIILVWLTVIWLLRHNLAGKKVRLRDGLYNAGAPLVPGLILALILAIQMVPVALVSIGYSAATSTGLLESGVEAMLFWAAAGGLTLLSVYFGVGTLLALVIVTIPGMYPLRALRMAGDIIIGRRIRIILRVFWGLLVALVSSFFVLLVFVLLDGGIKHLIPAIQWLPIISVGVLLVATAALIWTATYIYLLYRKVVEDESKPA